MNSRSNREHSRELYQAILTLQSEDECIRFFEDLCTMSELSAMEQRFMVAKALRSGKIYNEILAETGASSATISRVNRSLQYGAGGYDVVFTRIEEQEQ
ncbi:MAG: TrpR-like protein [Oscillospiraceae bacterium]|nr:TrpR-like protein [Oscillospiraceae bacterium]